MKPDYIKYPCCGYQHRWLPGSEKWVSIGHVQCSANSMEQLEDVRTLIAAPRGSVPRDSIEVRSLLTMPHEEYKRRKKEGTLHGRSGSRVAHHKDELRVEVERLTKERDAAIVRMENTIACKGNRSLSGKTVCCTDCLACLRLSVTLSDKRGGQWLRDGIAATAEVEQLRTRLAQCEADRDSLKAALRQSVEKRRSEQAEIEAAAEEVVTERDSEIARLRSG